MYMLTIASRFGGFPRSHRTEGTKPRRLEAKTAKSAVWLYKESYSKIRIQRKIK